MKSLKQYLLFVFQDRIAYGQQPQYKWLFSICRQPNALKLVYYLRNAQYFNNLDNKLGGVVCWFWKKKYNSLCDSLNVFLPFETQIGPGLRFPHSFPLVINPEAKIGKCCTIHPCVLIGRNRAKEGAPIIGDYCFIGHGVKIIGNPIIGDNCFISPAAIVTKDIPSGSLVGAGLNNIIGGNGKEHVEYYL